MDDDIQIVDPDNHNRRSLRLDRSPHRRKSHEQTRKRPRSSSRSHSRPPSRGPSRFGIPLDHRREQRASSDDSGADVPGSQAKLKKHRLNDRLSRPFSSSAPPRTIAGREPEVVSIEGDVHGSGYAGTSRRQSNRLQQKRDRNQDSKIVAMEELRREKLGRRSETSSRERDNTAYDVEDDVERMSPPLTKRSTEINLLDDIEQESDARTTRSFARSSKAKLKDRTIILEGSPDSPSRDAPRRDPPMRELEEPTTLTIEQQEAAEEVRNLSNFDTPYNGGTALIFDYPPGQRGKIRVTEEERGRLKGQKYLNDSLIDFYIKYQEVQMRSLPANLKFTTLFFSSFFFGCLRRKDPIDYPGVKGWTKNIDIFKKKFIFVPICDSYHWSLIIVANLDKLQPLVQEEEEQEPLSSSDTPRIIYLDSLNPKRGIEFGRTIRNYLCEEYWSRKMAGENNEASRKATISSINRNIVTLMPNVPIQTNEVDCGLYLLNSLQMFLCNTDRLRDKLLEGKREMRNIYTSIDIAILRDRIIHVIFFLEKEFKRRASMPEERALPSVPNHEPVAEEMAVPDVPMAIPHHFELKEVRPEMEQEPPVDAPTVLQVSLDPEDQHRDPEVQRQVEEDADRFNDSGMVADDEDEVTLQRERQQDIQATRSEEEKPSPRLHIWSIPRPTVDVDSRDDRQEVLSRGEHNATNVPYGRARPYQDEYGDEVQVIDDVDDPSPAVSEHMEAVSPMSHRDAGSGIDRDPGGCASVLQLSPESPKSDVRNREDESMDDIEEVNFVAHREGVSNPIVEITNLSKS